MLLLDRCAAIGAPLESRILPWAHCPCTPLDALIPSVGCGDRAQRPPLSIHQCCSHPNVASTLLFPKTRYMASFHRRNPRLPQDQSKLIDRDGESQAAFQDSPGKAKTRFRLVLSERTADTPTFELIRQWLSLIQIRPVRSWYRLVSRYNQRSNRERLPIIRPAVSSLGLTS